MTRRALADLLFQARILTSRIGNSAFFNRGTEGLHTARFARLHELSPLHLTRGSTKTHLPIGRGEAHSVLGLTPKPDRPELGNVAIFAPTRGGKGLDAVVKILTWQHSLVVNDSPAARLIGTPRKRTISATEVHDGQRSGGGGATGRRGATARVWRSGARARGQDVAAAEGGRRPPSAAG